MKELDPIPQDKTLDKQEIIAKKKHEKTLIRTEKRPSKNHFLWMHNTDTKEIIKIEVKNKSIIDFNDSVKAKIDILDIPKKVDITPSHDVYIDNRYDHVWALNKRNAIRKFEKKSEQKLDFNK